jgi:sigma-B regulation protein RsbU (phosphoserine phosphatase)
MAMSTNIFDRFDGSPDEQLDQVVRMMREMSRNADPQSMVHDYAVRMRDLMKVDRGVAISRRDLSRPQYRVTRPDIYVNAVDPWKESRRLAVYDRGLLGELIYADAPTLIDDLKVDPDDPCAALLAGQRSLAAIPVFDDGEALNMVIFMRREPNGFSRRTLAQTVHMSNLFGRATKNLVLTAALKKSNTAMEAQMRLVADIQRSLLPSQLPDLPTMDLAVHYRTSEHAGGDYYDFFPLDDGRWGMMIADVCGHGTPAAVLMAVTHCLAHTRPDHAVLPDEVLKYVNDQLTRRYTTDGGTFVTAFFGVYDPQTRGLDYACAGHNPPRVKRCADGTMHSLDQAGGIPLGILQEATYARASFQFMPGDQALFYTDGIVEARNPNGDLFDMARLDATMVDCGITAQGMIDDVLAALDRFADGWPPDDDRTLLAAKIR